jgi:ankyrin repeat protein
MQDEQIIEADTLEEVRKLAALSAPKGFKISSEKVLNYGYGELRGAGASPDEALSQLKNRLPSGAEITGSEVVRVAARRTFDLQTSHDKQAGSLAEKQLRSGEVIDNIERVQKARRGIFGLGRRLGRHHVYVTQMAEVKLRYKDKAKASFTYKPKNIFDALREGAPLDEIKVFLDSGIAIDSRNDRKETLLMWAANVETLEFLLKSGADVHAQIDGGYTALMRGKNEAMMQALIDQGADVNAATTWGSTRLSDAAQSGETKIVELLLKNGVNVNSREYDGYTPLSRAAMGGHEEIVVLLLTHGADVTVKTKHGHTAMSLAIQNRHGEIFSLIESYQEGAKPKTIKRTKSSEDWDRFFANMSERELTGEGLLPQLILCSQTASMATRLFFGVPKATGSLVDGQTEIVEFRDGKAATIFHLKDGKDILKFVDLLFQGNFGTEPLRIKNGVALRLPVTDRESFRQSLGIVQILTIGTTSQARQETFVWW